jgi:hypothetical protein
LTRSREQKIAKKRNQNPTGNVWLLQQGRPPPILTIALIALKAPSTPSINVLRSRVGESVQFSPSLLPLLEEGPMLCGFLLIFFFVPHSVPESVPYRCLSREADIIVVPNAI